MSRTSTIERARARQVAANAWAIELHVDDPSIATQNAYILRDRRDGLHLVDPGEKSGDNLEALAKGIEALGSRIDRVRTITLTHLHADHGQLSEDVRQLSGAQLILHEREQSAMELLAAQTTIERRRMLGIDGWGVPRSRREEATVLLPPMEPLAADIVITGDEPQRVPEVPYVFIPTPGHTSGHLCVHDPRDGILLTGDHILPRVTPAVGIGGPSPSNPLADYLSSLDRVRRYADSVLLPGHGAPFSGLDARADEIALRHRRRIDEVSAVVDLRPQATVWEVASALAWRRPWSSFHGTYLASALLQTHILIDFVGQELQHST